MALETVPALSGSPSARDADVMQDLTDIEMRCANLVETFQAREVVVENRLGIPMAEQPASNAADLDQRGLQIHRQTGDRRRQHRGQRVT
jgi:hypothetical protein